MGEGASLALSKKVLIIDNGGTHHEGLCRTRGIHPRVCQIALFWGLTWRSDGNQPNPTLLLTAAPFGIVRQDLFEIVEQSKLD